MNTILSWKALVPLSRLTYCIYLLHIMVMGVYLYSKDSLFYYSDSNVVSMLDFCAGVDFVVYLGVGVGVLVC